MSYQQTRLGEYYLCGEMDAWNATVYLFDGEKQSSIYFRDAFYYTDSPANAAALVAELNAKLENEQ